MLKRSIISLELILLLFLAALPASAAASGERPVGTVPWLLIGSVDRNPLYEECTLGDAAADAVRRAAGADIAVVGGGWLTGNLPPGEVTETDVADCLAPDSRLASVPVSPAELSALLEVALSRVVTRGAREYDAERSPFEAFPQISGFRVAYDPNAEPGSRISRITINDEPLDRTDTEKTILLAAPEEYLQGYMGLPVLEGVRPLEQTLRGAMEAYIRDGLDDYSIPEKRVYAQEMRSALFLDSHAILTIVVICAVICVLLLPLGKKYFALGKRGNPEDSAEKNDENDESDER